jgi:hypothetical protein
VDKHIKSLTAFVSFVPSYKTKRLDMNQLKFDDELRLRDKRRVKPNKNTLREFIERCLDTGGWSG